MSKIKGMSVSVVIERLQILQKAGHGNTPCHIAFGDEAGCPVTSVEMSDLLDDDENESVGKVIWFAGH